MRFVVGGEEYEFDPDDVRKAVKDLPIETIHEHIVEIDNQVYPPKQVFGAMSGRQRQTFTTQEAQRVLSRLGFVCRRAGRLKDGTPAWLPETEQEVSAASLSDLLGSLELSIRTMQAAITGLDARVKVLEA